MCTSRLPEALWPTERPFDGHLQLPRCLRSHSAGSIASRASLVLHVHRWSLCTTTSSSKQHVVVQLDTLLTLYRYLSMPRAHLIIAHRLVGSGRALSIL